MLQRWNTSQTLCVSLENSKLQIANRQSVPIFILVVVPLGLSHSPENRKLQIANQQLD
jgi:hypothetical protein